MTPDQRNALAFHCFALSTRALKLAKDLEDADTIDQLDEIALDAAHFADMVTMAVNAVRLA